jgi:archaellum component FlaC
VARGYTPADLQEIKNRFTEISNSWTRVSAEQDLVKEIFTDLKEEFEIPPKMAKKLARAYHKRNVQEVIAEDTEFAETYDKVFENK